MTSSGAASFLSDNAAGAHPEVLEALVAANRGRAPAYGDDPLTERTHALLRRHFGDEAHPFLVFSGTAANVLAIQPLLEPFESVLCASSAHLWIDECGAAERSLGCKLIPIESADGKLTPDLLEPQLRVRGNVHHSQPKVVSITQPTEWGTVYSLDELRDLARFTREHDLRLHVDGARLANAAARLGVTLRELSSDIGVDSLSFGGTKNGLLFGEAVLVFDAERAAGLSYYRKQLGQLPSKMRFVAAQFEALLGGDLWLRSARHANAMAERLAAGLAALPGLEVVQPVEANGVFFRAPREAVRELQSRYAFHLWDPQRGIARLMTGFDTSPQEVDAFVQAAGSLLAGSSRPPVPGLP